MTLTNTEATATIADLPLERLHGHPDNPRLQLREDVVERLAAEISASGFGPEHALIVRPIHNGHQVISGHHRLEAARRVGRSTVPCWIKDLGDDEAFMQLVLSNTQGELSPLEIGMHALRAVPREQGRKGAGLAAYAERLGRTGEYIGQLRSAASVLKGLPNSSLEVADKPKHLYEISKAPRSAWAVLVGRLVGKGWTVAETKAAVDKIRQFEIPAAHADWLPLDDVIAAYLKNDRFNPATVTRLIKAVDAIRGLIADDGSEQDQDQFDEWLRAGIGADAWDHRKISDYHAHLIREFADRREAEAEAAIVVPDGIDLRHGDLREILTNIPDGSVDAVITDPPYPAEFLPLFTDLAVLAKRILRTGGVCAVMIGQSYLPQIAAMLGEHLDYHWTIGYLTPGGQAVQVWQRKVNTFWKPVLLYTKGEYAGDWLGDVAESKVNDNDKNHHHWGQSESGMADLVARLTKPGQLVCDPFLGGGTTAVVCHGLSRRFVGCDVDETAVKTSIGRFAAAGGDE